MAHFFFIFHALSLELNFFFDWRFLQNCIYFLLQDQDLSDEEEESMNPLLIFIFNFLLDSHNAKDRAVRFRSCQLINKLLTYMDEHVSIDEDLFDRIYDCMLIRLRDKFPTIRTQAVLALYRLQEPTDEECPVISSFLHLMENDNNPEVRRAVLCNIAVRTTTLQPIIGKIMGTGDPEFKK